jgi:hypothetical protein
MTTQAIIAALRPLAAIADAYDENRFDFDGARKFWGQPDTHKRRPFESVEMFSGRGGKRLLTLADAFAARDAIATGTGAEAALKPLVGIADAWDANELDDHARKHWGADLEHTDTTDPVDIYLVDDRDGTTILTLADALAARAAA